MKIVHLALQSPYNEGWGYQENLLPKYHAKMGHDVTLLTSCRMNSTDSIMKVCEPQEYDSPDGFHVIRIEKKKSCCRKIVNILNLYDVYDIIKKINPDFIMVHGLGSFSALQVKKFLKKINPECTVIADNHLDGYNSAVVSGKGVSNWIKRRLWYFLNKRMRSVYKKVYGVTPNRAEVAKSVFGFDDSVVEILPAGADDEKIRFENKATIRKAIREQYGIEDSDFLLLTGGKIDKRKNIDLVMRAVGKIERDDVKLIVFGNCSDSIKEEIESLSKHPSVIYIGWIDSTDVYDYFLASDLAIFPGTHSVLWEQACACGVPALFKKWDGMTHVCVNGNSSFINGDSEDDIQKSIQEIVENRAILEEMKSAADVSKEEFSYTGIAKRVLKF